MQQLHFLLLYVSVFPSAYSWSNTESTLKSQTESEGVTLSVTHQQQQQQPAKDSPVERPQAKLSMCNVKLVISLISQLKWRGG